MMAGLKTARLRFHHRIVSREIIITSGLLLSELPSHQVRCAYALQSIAGQMNR
jgi:hypothetical protein